ncbi:uncharacterized protein PHACADRAFT_99102, partial [Phanerochaete carnosa HHB-10118-sp]
LALGRAGAIWEDWHDVLGVADVEQRTSSDNSVATHTTKSPTDLFSDDDDILAEIPLATSRTQAHDLDLERTRYTVRLAHVMDNDAAALLAVRLYLELSSDHTLARWRCHGRAALGLAGDEPAYHFEMSQNCWNHPAVHSPARPGHLTPGSASTVSSGCSVDTPSDGQSPAAMEQVYVPTTEDFNLADSQPWLHVDTIRPITPKFPDAERPFERAAISVRWGVGETMD